MRNRRDALTAVSERAEYLQRLLDASFDVIFTLNAKGEFIYISAAWERQFGFPVSEVIGKSFIPFVHPDDAAACIKYLRQIMSSMQPGTSPPYRVRHADGSWKIFTANGTPYFDNKGELLYNGVGRDITELKRQEEALQLLENKYHTLYESSADAIMIFDGQKFTDCNQATLWMFGVSSKEDFTRFHPAQLSPPYQPDGIDSLTAANYRIAEAYERGNIFFEWVHRRTNGEDFYADVLLTVMTLGEKKVVQATVRDISERKVNEVKLQSALQLAKAGAEARSEFLANITHELVTPLNSIIGFSQVLLDDLNGSLNDKQRKYLQVILESGERLNEAYSEIIQIASLGSGEMLLQISCFLLKELVESSLQRHKHKAQSQGITLTLVNSLPADTIIEADRNKLVQVMFNLLDNAIKFTPKGGDISVMVSLTNGESLKANSRNTTMATKNDVQSFIEISVSDSGIGIKEEDMPRLFMAFQQLESPYTKRYTGTGLGLLLTKKLVELHGGSIRVESKFGSGSRFTFMIPMQQKITQGNIQYCL